MHTLLPLARRIWADFIMHCCADLVALLVLDTVVGPVMMLQEKGLWAGGSSPGRGLTALQALAGGSATMPSLWKLTDAAVVTRVAAGDGAPCIMEVNVVHFCMQYIWVPMLVAVPTAADNRQPHDYAYS